MKRIITSSISIVLLLTSLLLSRADEAKSLSIYPLEQALLTQQDFTQANVVTRSGKVIFQAILTEAASAKLKEYSLKHVGQKLAVVSGAQIIAAPEIRSPLGQKFEIDALSKSEAETLAQLINNNSSK